MATLDAIRDAAARIAPHVHRTPVMTSRFLSGLAGVDDVLFKCEALQKTGSFKARGACNAVLKLSDADAAKGVTTHSSGNHGQALAYAASLRGIPARVVMPRDAPASKVAAVRDTYGGDVVLCEPGNSNRVATVEDIVATTGARLVHPSNDIDVICGQGTMALELLEQVGDVPLDAVIVPVGGGGMLTGVATVVKALHPAVRVFAAEPAGADDAARSKAAGHVVGHREGMPCTIADGLRTVLGDHTWPAVRDHVEEVLVVEEGDIVAGMRLVWQRMKLCIEPSAGVGVAALLSPRFKALAAEGGMKRVAVVLCGGNVDVDRPLPWQVAAGAGAVGSGAAAAGV